MGERTFQHDLVGPLSQREAIAIALAAFDAQQAVALRIYPDERRQRLVREMTRRGRAEIAALADGAEFALYGVELELFAWFIAPAAADDHEAVLARLDLMPESLERQWGHRRRELSVSRP